MHGPADENDETLFDRFKNGDDHAYRIIYERFSPMLYLHGYKFLKDDDQVKDLIQDLFTTLWNKRQEISISSSLSAYLYGSVKNKILDHIAHQNVRARYETSLQGFIETGYCFADQKLREEELKRLIEQGINNLPAKMREIFEMSRMKNLSHKEIAEQLKISDKTVKKQVSNALKALRVKIGALLILLP